MSKGIGVQIRSQKKHSSLGQITIQKVVYLVSNGLSEAY